MNDAVLHTIRTRRVARALTDAPVEHDQLRAVLDSARYAPHAGNRRLHRYVVVTRPSLLRAVRMVSPGMLQHPMAAIVVCLWDFGQGPRLRLLTGRPGALYRRGDRGGDPAAAAHSIGLAAGPVTSFSRTALATILNLPAEVEPELIICLGHAATGRPPGYATPGLPGGQHHRLGGRGSTRDSSRSTASPGHAAGMTFRTVGSCAGVPVRYRVGARPRARSCPCSGRSGEPQCRSSVWLPAWLPTRPAVVCCFESAAPQAQYGIRAGCLRRTRSLRAARSW